MIFNPITSKPLYMSIFIRKLSQYRHLATTVNSCDLHDLANHMGRQHEQRITRTLRRQTLADYLQVSPASLDFLIQPYGKPYLANFPKLQFSQSHSNDHWLLVVNQQQIAVGIDIEDKQRITAIEPLARHILTENEFDQFQQTNDKQRFLLKLWTIKEAILKASGLGIRVNLNTLDTGCDFEHQGQVQHSQLGVWCYQCFETDHSYYTVAWQADYFSQVIFETH